MMKVGLARSLQRAACWIAGWALVGSLSLSFNPVAVSSPDPAGQAAIDLGVELAAALGAGKQGLAVYFGQADCAYCERFLALNLTDPDIAALIQRRFAWIALDIHAKTLLRTPAGELISVSEWAKQEGTDFTPSVLLYDAQGQLALKLRGYYPPYQFRAALDYVAEGYVQREPFAAYLARGNDRLVFDDKDLNPQPFFSPPPHILDRRLPAERPLAVFLERGDCHPCDLLHSRIRQDPGLQRAFAQFDVVQLDLYSETPLIAPDGRRLKARTWAAELGIPYAPAIVFFDEVGRELMRLNSVKDLEQIDKTLVLLLERVPVALQDRPVFGGDPAPAVIIPSPGNG